MRTMARCYYETPLSSRAFSCEGVREDIVGCGSHVEVFHLKIRFRGNHKQFYRRIHTIAQLPFRFVSGSLNGWTVGQSWGFAYTSLTIAG